MGKPGGWLRPPGSPAGSRPQLFAAAGSWILPGALPQEIRCIRRGRAGLSWRVSLSASRTIAIRRISSSRIAALALTYSGIELNIS